MFQALLLLCLLQSFYVLGKNIKNYILLFTHLYSSIRQSAWFNTFVVSIKLLVILIFIFGLCGYMYPPNYQPYIPPNTGDWHYFGVSGIFAAATIVFFSYIGFDAVTAAALEAKNPRRDLPVGIIGSLTISTILYLVFCTIMTGAAKYTDFLHSSVPAVVAVEQVELRTGKDFTWLNVLVCLGAVCGLTSVLLINLLGQSRVFFSMAKDGLLPQVFCKVHPKFKTPYIATLTIGFITAVLAAVLPVDLLGNMTSVGTLLAFFVVHVGVIVMRFTRPDAPRRFKIPGGKYFSLIFPLIGMFISVALIALAEVTTIWRLFIWMGIGWVIYFTYSIRHSKFNKDPVGHFHQVSSERNDQVQEFEIVNHSSK